MSKIIVYKSTSGAVSIITPSIEWEGTLQQLAGRDVPVGHEWRIVDEGSLPKSRAWRCAWVDGQKGGSIGVDLDMAKVAHRKLIISLAHDRIEADEFGVQDFSTVKKELSNIDFGKIKTLDELYNTWCDSISVRKDKRKYAMHG